MWKIEPRFLRKIILKKTIYIFVTIYYLIYFYYFSYYPLIIILLINLLIILLINLRENYENVRKELKYL